MTLASVAAHLRFENLTLGYERHPAVHHLDGEVAPGALLAVMGPNGAGKSTLLKGIVGVLRPLQGRIVLRGVARRDIAYLPQLADVERSFPINVRDFVAMGCWRSLGAFRGFGRREREKVEQALAAVGLSGFEARPISSLSGGQLQRSLFARLLLQDASLILLDEPFTAIDSGTARDLMDLIQRWHGEGRTVVAVLHDLDLVRERFPETLLLARSPVAWGRTAECLSARNLLRARQMGEAFDDAANVCRKRVA
jgi:zinc/manganese transport system ATP-binding protein